MSSALLDSDAVIDWLFGIDTTVALLSRLVGEGSRLCTCDVVIGEVWAGVRPADTDRAERVFAGLEFLATTAETARRAGEWRYAFARRGQSLSLTDCLIAATALAHGAQLVTGNVAHYPMPELEVVSLPRASARRRGR